MIIHFYAMLAGILTCIILHKSKDCFSDEYPKDKKNMVITICTQVAKFSTFALLTLIL